MTLWGHGTRKYSYHAGISVPVNPFSCKMRYGLENLWNFIKCIKIGLLTPKSLELLKKFNIKWTVRKDDTKHFFPLKIHAFVHL